MSSHAALNHDRALPGDAAGTDTTAALPMNALTEAPALPQVSKVLLVLDLVESVRLMADDEDGVVTRWHGFTTKADKLVSKHGGRIIRSLGDGLLAEFEQARDAVQVATALHALIKPTNQGRRTEQHFYLRVGLNAATVYVDDKEVYGAGVNLAARLASLAGPGETIASASVRDLLTDGLDADVEDLGECFLKHVEAPVRAYRIGPPGPRPGSVQAKEALTPLQPTIAVIPFSARSTAPEQLAIGELIADGVIGRLSRSRELRVISRMSTTAFRHRPEDMVALESSCKANFALRGSYVCMGRKLLITAQLVDVGREELIWAEQIKGDVDDLLERESRLVDAICQAIMGSILRREAGKVMAQPLPSLQSYSLLLGSITLMHRTSLSDFQQAKTLLEHLIDRHPRLSQPHAWLANWYALCMSQGFIPMTPQRTQLALDSARRALDLDGSNALGLAIDGILHTHLRNDFDTARSRFDLAVGANPNEPLAWLYKSVLHGFTGEAQDALAASRNALSLSPLDPMRHYFDSLAASAALGAGEYGYAAQLAEQSMRVNRLHPSTYRALAIAQVMQGQTEQARTTVQQLRRISPEYTLKSFRASAVFKVGPLGPVFADALAAAGLPA